MIPDEQFAKFLGESRVNLGKLDPIGKFHFSFLVERKPEWIGKIMRASIMTPYLPKGIKLSLPEFQGEIDFPINVLGEIDMTMFTDPSKRVFGRMIDKRDDGTFHAVYVIPTQFNAGSIEKPAHHLARYDIGFELTFKAS